MIRVESFLRKRNGGFCDCLSERDELWRNHDQEGLYHIKAPAGDYTLVVSAVGYTKVEKKVKLVNDERMKLNITIAPETQQLDEVTIVSTGVSRVKRSAFNAVAVDTKELQNTTKNLSDALTKAPGMNSVSRWVVRTCS